MRIGIITFWQSDDNYGQQLQVFALQKALKKVGHRPFLIRYCKEESVQSKVRWSKCFDYILNFRSYFNYFLQRRREKKYSATNDNHLRKFSDFRNTYVDQTSEIFSRERLISDPPEADAYICGSDQIWGGEDVYYLSFVSKGKKKIAYAPSLGGVNPFVSNQASYIKALLKDFVYIGMREKAAADLLNAEGIKAEQVVDPTLLLDAADYLEVANCDGTTSSTKDVFVYLLGNPVVCKVDEIFGWLKKKNLSNIYVASQGRVDKYEKSSLTIPQWIKQISEAKYVITNSFHCVVFSLIFHKPFVFIPLAGSYARMNGRLDDLLVSVGLSTRVYRGQMDVLMYPVDFSQFDRFHKQRQDYSNSLFKFYL